MNAVGISGLLAGEDVNIEKVLAGQRSPRNQVIVEVLRDYGYVDARGMGVRHKIVPLMLEGNGVRPDFEATEDHVRVVLPRAATKPERRSP
ncbi:MAG: ATP-binding protein [Burkholderiaceae bacterium]